MDTPAFEGLSVSNKRTHIKNTQQDHELAQASDFLPSFWLKPSQYSES